MSTSGSTPPSRPASVAGSRAGAAKPPSKSAPPRPKVTKSPLDRPVDAGTPAGSVIAGAPGADTPNDVGGALPSSAGTGRGTVGVVRDGAGAVGRAVKLGSGRGARVGGSAARGSVSALGKMFAIGGPAPAASTREPFAGVTLKLPLVSGSVRLPGPGAVASVGPVRVTLPTGTLYYGGLAALVVGGGLELPVAAGAALAGAMFGRRWLRGPVPEVSVYDTKPGGAPAGTAVSASEKGASGVTEVTLQGDAS